MITDIIAGFLSGLLGAMGLGGGGILILYLTIIKNISQVTAQGINLIFFIPIAISAITIHTKNKLIEWRIAVRYMVYGLLGVAIGFMILENIDENICRKIFSSILILIGVREIFRKYKE